MRKIVCLVSILLCTLLLFSGCVNATYTFQLQRNGSLDADYKILFDSKTADAEAVNALILEFRKHFTEDKYEVVDWEESGFAGIRVSKKNVSPEELAQQGKADKENVDYSGALLKGLTLQKGVLTTRFQLNSTIDLTFLTESFLTQKKQELLPQHQNLDAQHTHAASVYQNKNVTIIDHTEETAESKKAEQSPNVMIDDGEAKNKATELPQPQNGAATKLLANATMKVVIQFPDKVTSSNAGKVSEDGKTLEWILIPGTANTLKAEGQFINTTGMVGFWSAIGIVVLLMAYFGFFIIRKRK